MKAKYLKSRFLRKTRENDSQFDPITKTQTINITLSLVTGTIALAFSAIGILGAGYVITRFKPSARKMAAWNVIVGFMTVVGISSYAFIGCPGNEQSVVVNIPKPGDSTCISNCSCDYVAYTPVCGEDGYTYISPCHAGCTNEYIIGDKKKVSVKRSS